MTLVMERVVDTRGNEALLRENRELKQLVDKLERENRELKRAVYDLNMRLSQRPAVPARATLPFDVDSMLASPEVSAPGPVPPPNGAIAKDSERGREFSWMSELKGHSGAVYCVQYSPCGRLLASGSFDKTVRLWDVIQQQESHVLTGHSQAVSDLSWTFDSKMIITGSLDGTVRTWSAETGVQVTEHACEGMVQVVAFVPNEPFLCLTSTSRSSMLMIDTRQEQPVLTVANDSIITSLYPFRSEKTIVTGDYRGMLKTWDLRQAVACIDSVANDGGHKPISHITVSRGQSYFDEGRFLAVNSYDSVLRVYDRGSLPPKGGLTFARSVHGHSVLSWPIRSNFFHGAEHQMSTKMVRPRSSTSSTVGSPVSEDSSETVTSVGASLLLASGSADHNVYLYDVGGSDDSGAPLQVLSGHGDRVYSVHFHPSEPILASCSADTTVRIWSAKKGQVLPSTAI